MLLLLSEPVDGIFLILLPHILRVIVALHVDCKVQPSYSRHKPRVGLLKVSHQLFNGFPKHGKGK
jgi:hypothetical protein